MPERGIFFWETLKQCIATFNPISGIVCN